MAFSVFKWLLETLASGKEQGQSVRRLSSWKRAATNFASQKSCQNYCLSEACPPGTVVAKDGEGSRLVQCSNPGGQGRVSGGCPDGYTCYSSPLLDQSVCCGASTELQCE
ncbi:hypothetical protein OSTOST_24384 [Ostertagia ostertagi]